MSKPARGAEASLISRAREDARFRERLLAAPRETIEGELGVTLPAGHEVHVHEESPTATHVVLPPPSERSQEEREAARTGQASLQFLKKTLHDPAPPARPAGSGPAKAPGRGTAPGMLAGAAREAVRRGLAFLASTIDGNGAWHCIRFNVADPAVPRHFERPPFVSALCVLALERSGEERARAMCRATKGYLRSTIEYPGLWRYYRHLPQDLDSTTLCSLVLRDHPWIALGRNVPPMLANRDEQGHFMTWLLAEDEPDVTARFRIEADPVVNANVIAYLGHGPETEAAARWLEGLLERDGLEGSSKWYPDPVSICYAIGRAVARTKPALDRLRPLLVERILGLRDGAAGFGNALRSAQAVSALDDAGGLGAIDPGAEAEALMAQQREDGSWPEFLAFGDQTLRWGVFGQIGHGSESVTSAFCIEALERLAASGA